MRLLSHLYRLRSRGFSFCHFSCQTGTLLFFGLQFVGAEAETRFNQQALNIDNPSPLSVDVSQFAKGEQPEGDYHVEIIVNGEKKTHETLHFIRTPQNCLIARFSPRLLARLGVNLTAVPALQQLDPDHSLTSLEQTIPGATEQFDFAQQRWILQIPQAVLSQGSYEKARMQQWDNGLPALFLDYQFDGNTALNHPGPSDAGQNDNYFLNLYSGANLGGWRVRNYSTWTYQKDQQTQHTEQQWDSIETYALHDINRLHSQLLIGEHRTEPDIFDSVPFRGVNLYSEEQMLPDNQLAFAPTIRGVARTQALVSVKQDGGVIYQTTVPPGEFVLNRLYPTSISGDLLITITESDGQSHFFIQPFSTLPVMQREGQLKYSATAGVLNTRHNTLHSTQFTQTTLRYGLNNQFTLYGGLEWTPEHDAKTLGVGTNLGSLGALSMDNTLTRYHPLHGKKTQGDAFRLKYSKTLSTTGSILTFSGKHYNHQYYSLYDTQRAQLHELFFPTPHYQWQWEVLQKLGDNHWGTLNLSYYQKTYRESDRRRTQTRLSYNNQWRDISYAFSLYRSHQSGFPSHTELTFSISVPLTILENAPRISYLINTENRQKITQQIGLSGNLLDDRTLSYSFSARQETHGASNSASVSARYYDAKCIAHGGFNQSRHQKKLFYGAEGAVIAHPYGVTFSQPLSRSGDAMALVRAPKVKGCKVKSTTGIQTDWRGYAVVPNLAAYRKTAITLQSDSLRSNVEMDQYVQSVIPTSGALVLSNFTPRVGQRAILSLSHQGVPLPFGAEVWREEDPKNVSLVGYQGQVYLSGLPTHSTLHAKWDRQQCQFNLDFSATKTQEKTNEIKLLSLPCL